MKLKILLAGLAFVAVSGRAQTTTDALRSTGFPAFPTLIGTDIPGAPQLGQPQRIDGTEQEIRTEKHGLAYPAFYDWNKDGKTDLLVGEFETGKTGSDIKVFLNKGSNKKPRYTGRYFYALDTKGDTITNNQWCCIGIHPRFLDIDHDGITDMLSGQYQPGLITWWKGTGKDFAPGRQVSQKGSPDKVTLNVFESDQLDTTSMNYWTYTSAGFADFNGDGLDDLFVGGMRNMRVALNEGTKEQPFFGLRKYLLGVDGLPLSMVEPDTFELNSARREYRMPDYGGLVKGFVTPVDWDGDGVLDLLVTDAYRNAKAKGVVAFFRGIRTDKGLRFETGRPLFTTAAGEKAFPGCQPNICVTDYNKDGVMDLVIGLSLPTVNGYEIDAKVAWSYLDNLGIESPGKDAGEALSWAGGMEGMKQKISENPGFRHYFLGSLDDEKYLTLRHRGYVYVMLGKKNPHKAIAVPPVKAKEEVVIHNEKRIRSKADGPVTYEVTSTASITLNEGGFVDVVLNFRDGWHAYPPTEASKAMGFIPTIVQLELPDGIAANGPMLTPKTYPHGTYEVYQGKDVLFRQKIKIDQTKEGKMPHQGTYPVKVLIRYQVCDDEICQPPVDESVTVSVNVN